MPEIEFNEFDPNKPSHLGEWATFTPRRSKREFVVHHKRSQALNTITYRAHGKLYRLVDGKWELIATKPLHPGPRVCELCGEDKGYRSYAWAKDRYNKIPEVPVLVFRCTPCHQIPLP